MTRAIRPAPHGCPARRRGFTLVELIVVMTLLAIVAAMSAPRLAGFMRGRQTTEEARRVLAVLQYARQQAIGQGAMMEVWLEPGQGRYGLRPVTPYVDAFQNTKEFETARDVTLKVEPDTLDDNRQVAIRFWPDGRAEATTELEWIEILERDSLAFRVMQAPDRMRFVIDTGEGDLATPR